MGDDSEIELTYQAVKAAIGLDAAAWAEWPGGWPNDIEAALLDAVFSARAVYRTKQGRGVHQLVHAWIAQRPNRPPRLTALTADIERVGVPSWASDVVRNKQYSPGRSRSAPHGPMKAAAVLEAASNLIRVGVDTVDDFTEATAPNARSALVRVSGIGFATANYFFMLLGAPGVKPDRMIHRFLRRALHRRLTNKEAQQILAEVATRAQVEPQILDHAIWKHESNVAANR